MKKILFVINVLFLLTIGMITPFESSANEFYEMVNYLDISNLSILPSERGDMLFETISPIRVKKNVLYTIVMDKRTLGIHDLYPDKAEVIIEHVGSSTNSSGILTHYSSLNLYYFEFQSPTDYIKILELPADLGKYTPDPPSSYNVMLYEGSISDFVRFEAYVDPNEGFQKGFIPIDYDNQLTIDEVKNLITAKSPVGISVDVEIEKNNYKNNKSNDVGNYEMSLVANIGNNYRRFNLLIEVIDVVPPVISAPEQIFLGIALIETMDLNEIKTKFTVSDNADKNLTVQDLVIEEETFMNAKNVGEYMVKVSLTDSSGNKTTKTTPVILQDNRAPTISGPRNIYLYSSSDTLNEVNILSRFSAFDIEENTSKDVYIVSNKYNENKKPGIYHIEIESIDNSGNRRKINLFIHVIDDAGPIFHKDDLVLELSQANQMTNQQLITWFQDKINLMGESINNVQIIFNEYENNKTLGGTYNVYMQYERNEVTELAKIKINVENDKQLKPLNIAIYISLTTAVAIGLIVVIKRRK